MKAIKAYFVNRQLQKLVNQKTAYTPIPEKIRCIGLLAENEIDFLAAKEVIRHHWGFQVRLIGLFYDEQQQPRPVEGMSYRDFSIFGRPSFYFNEFLEEKPDFILVASINLNPYLRYLLHLKNNTFRIGFYNEINRSCIDLMVAHENEDAKGKIINLIEYLNRIKTPC
jgi:hypothetical protein